MYKFALVMYAHSYSVWFLDCKLLTTNVDNCRLSCFIWKLDIPNKLIYLKLLICSFHFCIENVQKVKRANVNRKKSQGSWILTSICLQNTGSTWKWKHTTLFMLPKCPQNCAWKFCLHTPILLYIVILQTPYVNKLVFIIAYPPCR